MRDTKKLQGSFSYVSQLGAPLPPTHLYSGLDFPLDLHGSPHSSSTSILAAAPQKGDMSLLPKGQGNMRLAHAYLALFLQIHLYPDQRKRKKPEVSTHRMERLRFIL